MSTSAPPRVSIGLPVRNGENYLEECLESILGQTFEDFELIISDNASTDATADICRRYAARDDRIQYHRNPENVGGTENFNCALAPARGTYFKWVAHDDRIRPEYLTRCVAALDRDPSAVLCNSEIQIIDGEGTPQEIRRFGRAMADPRPHVRFRRALSTEFSWMQIWGLFRREITRHTGPLGAHVGEDYTFVSNVALHGSFVEVEAPLLEFRLHDEQAIHTHSWRRPRQFLTWHDPSSTESVKFPVWREWAEYAAAVRRTSLPVAERIQCYRALADWGWRHRDGLRRDVVVPGMNGVSWLRWLTWLDPEARVIRRHIPDDATILLVDDEQLEIEIFGQRRIRPFVEHDGKYWGSPEDDAHAIRELERMREEGAEYVVFAWPSFWWLDYYTGLRTHLETQFQRLADTDRYVIFDVSTPTPS